MAPRIAAAVETIAADTTSEVAQVSTTTSETQSLMNTQRNNTNFNGDANTVERTQIQKFSYITANSRGASTVRSRKNTTGRFY